MGEIDVKIVKILGNSYRSLLGVVVKWIAMLIGRMDWNESCYLWGHLAFWILISKKEFNSFNNGLFV